MEDVMLRAGLISGILLLTGCASGGNTDPRPIVAAWTSDVAAVGEHGHGGFSTVTAMPDGETRVNLTLTGGSVGGRHPWHVHGGRCGEDSGAAVGGENAYSELEPNERGNASGTVVLSSQLDPEAEYHVDIHQSGDDSTVVGCGDLILAN